MTKVATKSGTECTMFSPEAGGFVHSGGGTDWVKASDIAEKDPISMPLNDLRDPQASVMTVCTSISLSLMLSRNMS